MADLFVPNSEACQTLRVLILGGDGYLGWPTAMALSAKGHTVVVFDNYFRRNVSRELNAQALMPNPNLHQRVEIWNASVENLIRAEIGDCTDYPTLTKVVMDFQPDAIIHYAEQPSAPYSMLGYKEAAQTLTNNLTSTFNVIWAVKEHCSNCHIIKLGTMGEYGTPNIDIEEGWLNVQHNSRSHKFLYPRTPGSLYHTTKVMDTDLLYFYARIYGIRVTDLMQGPVYGLSTIEADNDERLMPNFHYDDIFGTVLNRFMVQAVAGIPLTVYGTGGQKKGFLNILDTLQCVELAMLSPPNLGELRILNQFTEVFSVSELAEKVYKVGNKMGLNVNIEHITNPRKESEDHYFNVKHSGLLDLGLQPHFMNDNVMAEMIKKIAKYKDLIDPSRVMPRTSWRDA